MTARFAMKLHSISSRNTLIHYARLAITLAMLGIPSALFADISDINGEIEKCSKLHGYDPQQWNKIDANTLGKNERVFLACVYNAINEVLVPKALIPDDYNNLIASHKQLTNAVERGEITRQERHTRIKEILGQIKTNEAAETERRIQDLSAKRDQFLRARERMIKRNPRMF